MELQGPVDAIGRADMVQKLLDASILTRKYQVTLDDWMAKVCVLGLGIKPEDFPRQIWVGGHTLHHLHHHNGQSAICSVEHTDSTVVSHTKTLIEDLKKWEAFYARIEEYLPAFIADLKQIRDDCRPVWDISQVNAVLGEVPSGLSRKALNIQYTERTNFRGKISKIVADMKHLDRFVSYITANLEELDIFLELCPMWDAQHTVAGSYRTKARPSNMFFASFLGNELVFSFNYKGEKYNLSQFLDKLVERNEFDALYVACWKQKQGLT